MKNFIFISSFLFSLSAHALHPLSYCYANNGKASGFTLPMANDWASSVCPAMQIYCSANGCVVTNCNGAGPYNPQGNGAAWSTATNWSGTYQHRYGSTYINWTNWPYLKCGCIDKVYGENSSVLAIYAPTGMCQCGAARPYWDGEKCLASCPNGFPADSNGVCMIPQKTLGESCPRVGNPIAVTTGNKFQVETDFEFGDLKMQRTYNSLLSYAILPLRPQPRMGKNWVDFYDRNIKLSTNGNDFGVYRHDGKYYSFKLVGGNYVPDADIRDSLVKIFDANNAHVGFDYKVFEDDSVERYDSKGRLLYITNRRGQTTSLVYAANGNLQTVKDSLGNTLTFTYGTGPLVDRIVKISHSNGNIYEYNYDNGGANGRIQSVKFPSLKTRLYHYEGTASPHLLTGITNEENVRYVTWAYDNLGRAISSEGVNGSNKVTVIYNSNSATVTENGGSKVYNYTTILGAPRPTSVSQGSAALCSGESGTTFTYDSSGFISTATDVKGNKTIYTRDAKGREISRVEAQGTTYEKIIQTEYHPQFNLVSKIIETNKTTLFSYNSLGKLLEKRSTYNDGSTSEIWSYTYNEKGLLITENGPGPDIDDKFTYTYDTQNRLIAKTNSLGLSTQYTYDSLGRLQRTTEPSGAATDRTYDSLGRVASVTAAGITRSYSYDVYGNLAQVAYSDGSTEIYSYDLQNRLVSFKNRDGLKKSYTYNQDDIATVEVYDRNSVLLSTTAKTKDPINKTLEIASNGYSVKHYYNNACEVVKTTDSLSRQTNFSYDALRKPAQVTDPSGTVQMSYDPNGHLTQVTDTRGLQTKFTYNDRGEAVAYTNPDSGAEQFQFDLGKVVKRLDARGIEMTYQYDLHGRLAKISAKNGVQVKTSTGEVSNVLQVRDSVTEYDDSSIGGGKLRRIQNENSKLEYTYDSQGRVLSKTQVIGGKNLIVAFEYSLDGNLSKITYPSGHIVEYTYSSGKVSKISVDSQIISNSISYHSFGLPDSWIWGNGSGYTRQLNSVGQVSQYTLGDTAATVQYDPSGRVTEVFDPIKNLSQIFSYDNLNRLIFASSLNYNYDSNGNRLDLSSFAVSSASNRLVGGTKKISYDESGNVTQRGNQKLFYDGYGRLTSVMQIKYGPKLNVRLGKYFYNSHGERAYKISLTENGGSKTFYIYDENAQVLGEYQDLGSQEFVYLETLPVAVIVGNDIYYVETDHLGTPRALKNQLNKVVWAWSREAFGSSLPDEDVDQDGTRVAFNLRFPGQIYDAESGLHYNYFRNYDPSTGRYVQVDPLGLKDGLNPYAYVGANPLNSKDPLGLERINLHSPVEDLRLFLFSQLKQVDSRECQIDSHGNGNTLSGARFYPSRIPDTPLFSFKGGFEMNFDLTELVTHNAKTIAPVIRAQCPKVVNQCQVIRLTGCISGVDDDAIAQKLADEMGVKVIAPTTLVDASPLNMIKYMQLHNHVPREPGGKMGRWRSFCPKKQTKNCCPCTPD